jgi:hypothetical protein
VKGHRRSGGGGTVEGSCSGVGGGELDDAGDRCGSTSQLGQFVGFSAWAET